MEVVKRKNINMSDEIANWYENKALELGVTQTALMTIALKQYIDQERAMNVMENMKGLLGELKDVKVKLDQKNKENSKPE